MTNNLLCIAGVAFLVTAVVGLLRARRTIRDILGE